MESDNRGHEKVMLLVQASMADATVAHPCAGSCLDFQSIYLEYFDFVWRSSRRLGLDESTAEDICQEVFVVVHRRLHEFQGRSLLKTWIFGVLLGVVRNHRRTQQRRQKRMSAHAIAEAVEDGGEGRADEPDVQLKHIHARELLYRILDGLDGPGREVFVLAEVEQMPVAEIAEALRVNVNTVHSRLRKARRQFQNAAARYRAADGWRYR